MAQTLSVNIDSPVAGALVGPVVHVSGTVSVVGSGPPFVHQVDRVIVQVGTGSQVTAQVTGPDLLTAANLCDTAFGLWQARKTLIDGELATIVDALTSSGGTLAGFDSVVQGQLSGPDLDFTTLSKNDAAGEDISSDLAAPCTPPPRHWPASGATSPRWWSRPGRSSCGTRHGAPRNAAQFAGDPVGTPFVPAPRRGDHSVSDDWRPTSDGRVRQAEAPCGRGMRGFRACPSGRCADVSKLPLIRPDRGWNGMERDGTQNSTGAAAASDQGRDGLVRCAEAGQDSLGTNGRSTRLRSQR